MIGIKIREILSNESPPVANAKDPLAHIRKLFIRYGVPMIIIKEEDEAVGKITIKNMALNIIRNIRRVRILDNMLAGDIMDEIGETLSAEEDLETAIKVVSRIRDNIPILDPKTNEYLVLKTEDILGIFSELYNGEDRVGDVCEKNVLLGKANHSIIQLYKKMNNGRYDSVIIVDILKRPLGIITYTDIVYHPIEKIERDRFIVRDDEMRIITSREKYPIAEKIMTKKNIFLLNIDEKLEKAADEMFKRGIGHIPVVNNDLTLYGLLNKYRLISLL